MLWMWISNWVNVWVPRNWNLIPEMAPDNVVISIDDLPYRDLENFKVAWNKYRTTKVNKCDPNLVKTLEEAWQALQKAATCNHKEVRKGDPAWLGPLAKPSASDIAVTAKWLADVKAVLQLCPETPKILNHPDPTLSGPLGPPYA
jgi:hypothetical protein